MSGFSLRYREPDWNEPPHSGPGLGADIQQRPLSDKSYEELRMDASQRTWASKFVDLNASSLTAMASLKNLTQVVEIIVGTGDEQARWVVHQQLFTDDSEFASRALKSDFKEKNENTIRFPEEHPDIMEQYVRYLYTGCIVTFSLEHIIQMYCLGDRLQSLKFANACYETISRTSDSYTATQIKYIFDETYSQDRLRSLAISQVGKGILNGRYAFRSAHEQELLRDYMSELMQGVTAAVAEKIRGGSKWYPNFAHATEAPTFSFGQAVTSQSDQAGMSLDNGSISMNRPQQTAGSLFGRAPTVGNLFEGQTANTTTPAGGLFGQQRTSSSINGGGIFGTSRPPFSFANHQPQSTTTTGGLFGGSSPHPQPTNTSGLFGNNNNHTQSTNTGGLFGSNNNHSQSTTPGPLFGNSNNHSHSTSTGGLFGNNSQPQSANTGGGLLGNNTTSSLFPSTGSGHSSGNSRQTTGGLFGSVPSTSRPTGGLFGPSQSSQTTDNPVQQSQSTPAVLGGWRPSPSAAGMPSAARNQRTTFSSGPGDATPTETSDRGFRNKHSATPWGGSTGMNFSHDYPSNRAIDAFNNNQRHSSAPAAPPRAASSIFGNTSSASPFVVAPAPTGAPVFAFPAPSQQQSLSRTQQTSEKGTNDIVAAANTSNTAAHPPNPFGEKEKDSDDDASTLRTLERNTNLPAFFFDLRQPAQPVFGQSTPLSTGRVVSTGWRPTTNSNPSRSIGFSPDTPDDTVREDQKVTNKGKKPASNDEDLSEAFTNLSFPGIGSDMGHLNDFLKNNGGGKVSRDDTLSPGFERYLQGAAKEGKGKGKEDEGAEESDNDAKVEPKVIKEENTGEINEEISSPATVVGEITPESSNDEGELAAITGISNGKVTKAVDADATERARKALASFGARFI